MVWRRIDVNQNCRHPKPNISNLMSSLPFVHNWHHDGIMIWKRFQYHFWLFVKGTTGHRRISQNNGPIMRSFDSFSLLAWTRCYITSRVAGDGICYDAHRMSPQWNQVKCALTYLIPMLVSNPGETLIPVTSGKGIVWKGWMDTENPLASVTPLGYSWISANISSCRPECNKARKSLVLWRSIEALRC